MFDLYSLHLNLQPQHYKSKPYAGVISAAVFGLYGAATNLWDYSVQLEDGGAFDAFWEGVAYVVNAIVFFFSGVIISNFTIR